MVVTAVAKFIELSREDGPAGVTKQAKGVMEVVDREETEGRELVRRQQMAQVGPVVGLAGEARALRLKWSGVGSRTRLGAG